MALNKISGEWDMPKLKDLLDELGPVLTDVEITGFDAEELDRLFAADDPLDLDAEDQGQDRSGSQITCHCPKCGFEFEVPK